MSKEDNQRSKKNSGKIIRIRGRIRASLEPIRRFTQNFEKKCIGRVIKPPKNNVSEVRVLTLFSVIKIGTHVNQRKSHLPDLVIS